MEVKPRISLFQVGCGIILIICIALLVMNASGCAAIPAKKLQEVEAGMRLRDCLRSPHWSGANATRREDCRQESIARCRYLGLPDVCGIQELTW